MDAVVCKKVKLFNNRNSLSPNMYASDQDSESAYSESSKSYFELSPPHSSPSQQVPIITNNFTELTCDEKYGNKPYLHIIEQPQSHFRFRYKSEMIGTHGCLLGKSYGSSKTKTHPAVELMNYKGKAIIRCRLADEKSSAEHPHKLLDEDHDRDVSKEVPEDGSYKVAFPGLGIIHTAKKDVPKLLFAKLSGNPEYKDKDLHALCENLAKKINLNIVRLMFSAHDIRTGQQICKPVFSEPINNLKSAATNDLKICRMSRSSGRPRGGEDIFLLVEKVNKNNIEIRFVEEAEDGTEAWSAKGNFMKNDVHHQYAIVFRTPQYRNIQITSDVKVAIELVRPSDGRTSDRMEFTYKPEPMLRQNKKRKANSYSSIGSSSSGSIKSLSDFPAPVNFLNPVQQTPTDPNNYVMTDISSPFNHNIFSTIPKAELTVDLGNALAEHAQGHQVMLGAAFAPPALPAALLAKCIRAVDSHDLLNEFSNWLVGEGEVSEWPLLLTFVDNCLTQDHDLTLETLRFFETIIEKGTEHSIHRLVLCRLCSRGYLANPSPLEEDERDRLNDVSLWRERERNREAMKQLQHEEHVNEQINDILSHEGLQATQPGDTADNIHRVINSFLLLLPRAILSDPVGADYEHYIHDAHRHYQLWLDITATYNWPNDHVCVDNTASSTHSYDSRPEADIHLYDYEKPLKIETTDKVDDNQNTFKTDDYMKSDYFNPKDLDANYSRKFIKSEESLSVEFDEGPFLRMIFKLLANMPSQPYQVNLHLTSIISKLALMPHPVLHEYMLNPMLPTAKKTQTLFKVLQDVARRLTIEIPRIKNYKAIIENTRLQLMSEDPNYDESGDHNQLVESLIVLEEFCKELAAIAFVKYQHSNHMHR